MDDPRSTEDAQPVWWRRLAGLQRLELRASTMLLLCVPLTAAVSYVAYRLGRDEAWYAGAFSLAPLIVLISLVFSSGEFLLSCWRLRPQVQSLAQAVLCVVVTLLSGVA